VPNQSNNKVYNVFATSSTNKQKKTSVYYALLYTDRREIGVLLMINLKLSFHKSDAYRACLRTI